MNILPKNVQNSVCRAGTFLHRPGVHVLVRAMLPSILIAPKIETRQKILTTFDIKIQNEDKQIFLSLPNKHSEYSMKFLIFRIDAKMLTLAWGDMFNIFSVNPPSLLQPSVDCRACNRRWCVQCSMSILLWPCAPHSNL